MAGAIGWTRRALAQADQFDVLAGLPDSIETHLPDGSTLLGVHASPGRDDGAGIDDASDDAALAGLVTTRGTEFVVGGNPHDPTDRSVAGIRAPNPGGVGLPRQAGDARWLLLDADEDKVDVQS
jgi:hypothetical protein